LCVRTTVSLFYVFVFTHTLLSVSKVKHSLSLLI